MSITIRHLDGPLQGLEQHFDAVGHRGTLDLSDELEDGLRPRQKAPHRMGERVRAFLATRAKPAAVRKS